MKCVVNEYLVFFRGLFGGSRKHESRTVNIPQYQFSGPASNGMTNLQCATGGFVSGNIDTNYRTQGVIYGINLMNDLNNWRSNTVTVARNTLDWALGTGTETKFYINDEISGAFKNAYTVNDARDYYYKKYKGVNNLRGTSVTDYTHPFGLRGLWRAGLDPVEQFAGGFSVNIFNFDNKTLWFVAYNRTSMNSFLYDLGPDWNRSNWSPGGNTYQYYIWSESVKKRR
jgi:hypothetical protein